MQRGTFQDCQYLDDLVAQPEPAVPGGEAGGVDVIDEDLCVALAVLVLIAEGQAEQLRGVTRGALQLYLLEILSPLQKYFLSYLLYILSPLYKDFIQFLNLLFDRDIRDKKDYCKVASWASTQSPLKQPGRLISVRRASQDLHNQNKCSQNIFSLYLNLGQWREIICLNFFPGNLSFHFEITHVSGCQKSHSLLVSKNVKCRFYLLKSMTG